MERNSELPHKIWSLWLQGEDNAPRIVTLCMKRWRKLNTDYDMHILNRSDASNLYGCGIAWQALPPQALSDIVRAKILLENGGIWVDASLLPVQPLQQWLPRLLGDSGFFAFARPGPDRPISSWFLAAQKDNIIMRRWWTEICRYWRRSRSVAIYDIPENPAASVDPIRSEGEDEFPYFWFHYIFQYLLETDREFSQYWDRCSHISATPAHELQNILKKAGNQNLLVRAMKKFGFRPGPIRPKSKEIFMIKGLFPVQKLGRPKDCPETLVNLLLDLDFNQACATEQALDSRSSTLSHRERSGK